MAETLLSLDALKSAFASQQLFEDKTWQVSPQPWALSSAEHKELQAIGKACLEFYQASELLYQRSVEGKNLLRNRKFQAPWVADYLDRGKPDTLIEYARRKSLRRNVPAIIRPDLLVTDDGFALTEMDSVPGGIGLTAYLNQLYSEAGDIVGADGSMIEAFYHVLAGLRPDEPDPLVAIVVSDEASTYRPEMEWIAEALQQKGRRVFCLHPGDLFPLGDTLCADIDGNPQEVHVIYRFWELFDHAEIPVAQTIMDLQAGGSPLVVSPPMRPFQEEKLNLALFHHHLLEDFWRENLSKPSYKLLKRIIPNGWIMDPVDLPPNAVLDAPWVGGKPITHWEQLAEASQRERNLILKLSGFHENAWGARSVLLGSDASRDEWREGIVEATSEADKNLYILQEYRKPARRKHPIYDAEGVLRHPQGRVRLCPYYFAKGDEVSMQGVLATVCPADKKIIHGMRDAALLPSMVVAKELKES